MKVENSNISTTDNTFHILLRDEHRVQQKRSHIINKVEKGSTIVVQNRVHYIQSAFKHLNEQVTYRKLDGDPTGCICTNRNTGQRQSRLADIRVCYIHDSHCCGWVQGIINSNRFLCG